MSWIVMLKCCVTPITIFINNEDSSGVRTSDKANGLNLFAHQRDLSQRVREIGPILTSKTSSGVNRLFS